VDRELVRLLTVDGRMPNNALAEATGIAVSSAASTRTSIWPRWVNRCRR
jgi:DNA-binding Lrp family transcriptional regulator